MAFPPPPGRYQALDLDADGDSLLVDEPDVSDLTADDYEWAYGEDPYDPAPIDLPQVDRPMEERPDLRPTPPTTRRIGWGSDGRRADPGRSEPVRSDPPPRVTPVETAPQPGGTVAAPPASAEPPADPTRRNPNNRGGMTAEEIIERARRDG